MGLAEGDPVTEEQMMLFGAGVNPVTGEKLGRAYSVFADRPTAFETELERAASSLAGPARRGAGDQAGPGTDPWSSPAPATTDVPRPDAASCSYIAKATSHPRVAVAGFDLTFSPPKSVSATPGRSPDPNCPPRSGPRTRLRSSTTP